MTTSDSIKILDDFEGAMISDYSIKGNIIFMHLKKEKPTFGYRNKKFDYNLHFHFGIQNLTNKKNIIKFFIECKNEDELHQSLPRLWVSSDIDKEYEIKRNIVGKTDFRGKYFFQLSLDEEQILYVANFPPIRFSRLNTIFQGLSEKSKAKEVIVGQTANNYSIKAYEYGNINEKPTILFVAGFHPPERDTVAIVTIMEKFLINQWREEVLQRYSFSLIPILNPDGFTNAMQGSNIKEINFHWKFFGNSKESCPEAYSIWEYCSKIKPIVFFDFHAFTFQDNTARPYLIPTGYYLGSKSKLIQEFINNKLTELCENKFSKNEAILAPNLLATRLRNEFGTITIPKFHLHMKDGIDGTREMSSKCLEIVLNSLSNYKVTNSDEILKMPYGKIKTTLYDKLRIKMLNFWYFRLISLLKNIMKQKR